MLGKRSVNEDFVVKLGPGRICLDPQTTHKNWIAPHNFGGQTHF